MEPNTFPQGANAVARYFAALAEDMPCPVIQYGMGGTVLLANSRAQALLSEGAPGEGRRVLLVDGRDLWEVLLSQVAGGASLLDGSARVVLSDGGAATIWFAGFPAVMQGPSLSGAVVVVYDATDERIMRPQGMQAGPHAGASLFEDVARAAAAFMKAGAVFVCETEPDRPRLGRTLAAVRDGELVSGFEWDIAASPVPTSPNRPIVVVRSDLRSRFPDDAVAASGGYDAFAGALLVDQDGVRMGVLGAYFDAAIEDEAAVRGTMRLFATRVAPAVAALQAQRALSESEERYASLFAHGHLPILLVDPLSTQIVEANPAACRFYGLSEDELTTMSMLQLAAEAPESVRADLRSAAAGQRDYFILKQMTAAGAVRDVELFVGPVTVGGRSLMYAVMHDATEKRRAEAALERYKRDLEMALQRRTADLLNAASALEAEREKCSRFYRDMGLELKTPLQTILGLSETLALGLAGELNSEQTRQACMIGEAAKQLAALVEDFLELSRVEAGAVELRTEPFDLRHLAESVVVSVEAEAAERGLAVRAGVPPEPVDVVTDRTKVEQILMELVSNALKYTPQGEVAVEVMPVVEGQARIAVRDTGIGIAEGELPYVFEGFRHLRQGEAGGHVGSGLGLALCKRLAAALGGTIDVQSAVGVGTTFTLAFPAYAGPSAPA